MTVDLQVLAILLGLIVIAGAVVVQEVRSRREKEVERLREVSRFHDRAARASWAGASILSTQRCKTNHDLGGKVMINLRLEVVTTEQNTYSAVTTWLVHSTALASLQPGQHIPVKIDQEDPRIIYPNMTGMEFVPRRDQCKGEQGQGIG